jgi:hypothetical protein
VIAAARAARCFTSANMCETRKTEYDPNLLMFLLKAYDCKRFGDKVRTTFDANWNGNLEDLPEEFLKQVLQQIEAQAAAIAE